MSKEARTKIDEKRAAKRKVAEDNAAKEREAKQTAKVNKRIVEEEHKIEDQLLEDSLWGLQSGTLLANTMGDAPRNTHEMFFKDAPRTERQSHSSMEWVYNDWKEPVEVHFRNSTDHTTLDDIVNPRIVLPTDSTGRRFFIDSNFMGSHLAPTIEPNFNFKVCIKYWKNSARKVYEKCVKTSIRRKPGQKTTRVTHVMFAEANPMEGHHRSILWIPEEEAETTSDSWIFKVADEEQDPLEALGWNGEVEPQKNESIVWPPEYAKDGTYKPEVVAGLLADSKKAESTGYESGHEVTRGQDPNEAQMVAMYLATQTKKPRLENIVPPELGSRERERAPTPVGAQTYYGEQDWTPFAEAGYGENPFGGGDERQGDGTLVELNTNGVGRFIPGGFALACFLLSSISFKKFHSFQNPRLGLHEPLINM